MFDSILTISGILLEKYFFGLQDKSAQGIDVCIINVWKFINNAYFVGMYVEIDVSQDALSYSL